MNEPPKSINSPLPDFNQGPSTYFLNKKQIVGLFVKAYSFPFVIFLIFIPIKLYQIWDYINDPRYPIFGVKYIIIISIAIIAILYVHTVIGILLGQFAFRHLIEPWIKLYVKVIALSTLISMALPFLLYGIARALRWELRIPQINALSLLLVFVCIWPIFNVLNFTLFSIAKFLSRKGPNHSFNPDPAATGQHLP